MYVCSGRDVTVVSICVDRSDSIPLEDVPTWPGPVTPQSKKRPHTDRL